LAARFVDFLALRFVDFFAARLVDVLVARFVDFFALRFVDFFADFFAGTLAPSRRASDKPIAIACLRLVTFCPEPPLRSEPDLRSRIVFSTFDCAFSPYFAMSSSVIVGPADARFARRRRRAGCVPRAGDEAMTAVGGPSSRTDREPPATNDTKRALC
jgi:hypothetical protein